MSNMELLCCESSCDCRAYFDPSLLSDQRVLQNLLKTEDRYITNSSYFSCVQKDITPEMRRILTEWMLEVCEEKHCTEEVFPLAMNFLDRFLGVVPLQKTHLQLVGSVCLLLASKLREPTPLTPQILLHYSDYSIPIDQIPSWEVLVSARLKWDLAAVTAPDFLGHILYRIPIEHQVQVMVRRHAQTFIFLSAREHKFCMYSASIIAGAAIAAALNGIRWTSRDGWTLDQLMDTLTKILSVEKEYLMTCFKQLEEMISQSICSLPGAPSSSLPPLETNKATTPTDIRDIEF